MTGTIEHLDAGAFVVDYSFGRPAISDMLAIGVQGAVRYICKDNPQTHGKLVTLDEVRRLADAGIVMMLNYEQDEGLTWRGAAAGYEHGKVAAQWVSDLGYPQAMPILVSTDATTSSDKWPAIKDFMSAFNYEVAWAYGGSNVNGHYYGTPLLQYLEDSGVSRINWMAMATSWSSPLGETDRVHIRQKGYVLGVCDADYVRKPTPFWNINGVQPPSPTAEVDMSLVVLLNSQGWWKGLDDQGYARSIYGPEAQARMTASANSKVAIPSVTIPDAEWDSWPTAPPASNGQSIKGIHISSVPGDAPAY